MRREEGMPDAAEEHVSSPVCRLASDSDHAAVTALRRALGRAGDHEAWATERLRGDRSSPETQALFVADIRGRVVGYAVAEYFAWGPDAPPNGAPSGFYLAGIFVEPSQALSRRRDQSMTRELHARVCTAVQATLFGYRESVSSTPHATSDTRVSPRVSREYGSQVRGSGETWTMPTSSRVESDSTTQLNWVPSFH